ncbi:AAA domain-containing protein [Marinifilum sp. D737]|uniref:AAA domain-containing protein n=1 Tax=Marinifilum sp. D737 TaxID=2969628 RepID=UPI002276D248|nr:AAA domain-containing protein [Marinifilum sp. D737]MCY1636390.1 AAA domain-containing protein [Marinifilum sp. D737]
MPKSNTISWLNYYHYSLADGARMDIAASECDEGNFFDSFEEIDSDAIKALYKKLDSHKKDKKKKSKEEELDIEVILAPCHLKAKYSHGVQKRNVQKSYPFWIPARINKEGDILPPQERDKKPWFVRGVLEPLTYDDKYFPIISSVTKLDRVLEKFKFCYDSWELYWESCERFFEEVSDCKFNTCRKEGFISNSFICLIKAKEFVVAQQVLSLYDDLIWKNSVTPLLNQLLSFEKEKYQVIPPTIDLFCNKGHYGQYNNEFPLSHSQRKSILLHEQGIEGNVLAVNGPPGTGKTTLLQSVIANELVKSVLQKKEPPRIVASSTNNQAITNILDSFGGDLKRWIPNLNSIGAYMIGNDPSKQSESLKKGYQLLTKSNGLFGGHYMDHIHDNDIEELEAYFTQLFDEYFLKHSCKNIKDRAGFLESQVVHHTRIVDDILDLYANIQDLEQEYFPLSDLALNRDELNKTVELRNKLKLDLSKLKDFNKTYEDFCKENSLTRNLSLIPSFKKKFDRKFALFLQTLTYTKFQSCECQNDFEEKLLSELQDGNQSLIELNKEIEEKEKLFSQMEILSSEWSKKSEILSEKWNDYLSDKNQKLVDIIVGEFEMLTKIEQINRILDVSFRYDAFICALHYWEAKWIVKQKEEELVVNRGRKSRINTFERMSYLSPLFISTFHSLPGFCSYMSKTSDDWIQKPIYELFDLMIVDEAGQVSPEIAVPSFSLAKKALVVGDVHQIEPVWTIAYSKIDEGNLQKSKILSNSNFDDWQKKGVLCSSGSLMRLAQLASNYQINDSLKGSLLTEHRRCVDELVAFSNEYIYSGLLEPKVGSFEGINLSKKNENNELIELNLPPLCYLNIRGKSEKRYGSTYNVKEAEGIAKWIALWGNVIVNHYNQGRKVNDRKSLKDIIGVVTPFSAQKEEIFKQLRKYQIKDRITVGTVHALQGAEREIVLFSPAYGINHKGGLFFDNGFNMLNVALTRAKKHFVVMGNMSLFNPALSKKPSGGLAKYLFADEKNELSSSFLYDQESIHSKNRVSTLEGHQDCLKAAFKSAKKRVLIVSPFISIKAIETDRLLEKIEKSKLNGVDVIVYTDKHLDMYNGNLKPASKLGREKLIEAGAQVKILNGIHNKAIAMDDTILVEGSFNWLSAVRDKVNPYYRFEVSQIIREDEARIQIEQLENELMQVKGN